MPTMPTHTLNPQTGFTLIEVMLVVVIIGFMAAMATLAIGGNHHRNFQNDVQRLHQLLIFAQDRATFEQQSLGLRLTDGGYTFMIYSRESHGWAALDDQQLRPRQFELPTQPELRINGVALTLKNSEDTVQSNDNFEEAIRPDLLLLPDGEMSAFELILQLQDDSTVRHRLFSDGFSSIHLERLP